MSTGEFLKQHPICCFCGGSTPAATIDHQPARILFPDKHRPKGLEFPACSDCNRQTRADEALLAFLCRFAGSLRDKPPRDFHRLKDIIGTINQSFPGLLGRMQSGRVWIKQRGIWVRGGGINVNQPEVHLAACRVAAKLALATYYEFFSRPAVEDCLINTQWTHIHNRAAIESVNNIVGLAPHQSTLKQGKWEADDSFFLKYLFEEGQLFSAAILHESVALMSQLREPGTSAPWEKWQFVMAPRAGVGIAVISPQH